ncbi:MAG: hypothetical protein AAF430_18480 [Myxococcota bacterium]
MGVAQRLALPLSGRLRCSECSCRLRHFKRGIYSELISWASHLLLWGGVIAGILLANPYVFALGAVLGIAAEVLVPLELDPRDAPSVRRAERFKA